MLRVNLAMNLSDQESADASNAGGNLGPGRPSQEKSSGKRRPRKNLFCPHCDEPVPKTTFYRHKKHYYDSRAKRWAKYVNRELETSSDEDGRGHADAPPIPMEGDGHLLNK